MTNSDWQKQSKRLLREANLTPSVLLWHLDWAVAGARNLDELLRTKWPSDRPFPEMEAIQKRVLRAKRFFAGLEIQWPEAKTGEEGGQGDGKREKPGE